MGFKLQLPSFLNPGFRVLGQGFATLSPDAWRLATTARFRAPYQEENIGALQGKKCSLHGYIGVIPGCITEEHPLDMCIAFFAGN